MARSARAKSRQQIFGNENAEVDHLVLECYVDNISSDSHIITGRWGVGKTAYLFHLTRDLADALGRVDPRKRSLWYVSEHDLDSDQILEAYAELDDRKFARYLRLIWIAEIYRRACVVLSALSTHYGDVSNKEHWKEIRAVAASESAANSLWKQLPAALSLLRLIDSNDQKGVLKIQSGVQEIFSERLQNNVQICLQDIRDEALYPLIAIEPIETPLSDLEENSLAQEVISQLLNVFQQEFQPSEQQLLDVYISVPWHRYSHNDQVNLPQKIRQYVDHVVWDREKLLTFIERRIRWEFKRVGRAYSLREGYYWASLFEPYVNNDYCSTPYQENSFAYVLRHTNYRPRELQRVARGAVQRCSEKTGRSVDDILSGTGGLRVSGSHIKSAVLEYVEGAARDRKSESYRRFRYLEEVVESIKGLKVPCLPEEFSQRFPADVSTQDAFSWLWQAGMLGIEATCETSEIETLRKIFP